MRRGRSSLCYNGSEDGGAAASGRVASAGRGVGGRLVQQVRCFHGNKIYWVEEENSGEESRGQASGPEKVGEEKGAYQADRDCPPSGSVTRTCGGLLFFKKWLLPSARCQASQERVANVQNGL